MGAQVIPIDVFMNSGGRCFATVCSDAELPYSVWFKEDPEGSTLFLLDSLRSSSEAADLVRLVRSSSPRGLDDCFRLIAAA